MGVNKNGFEHITNVCEKRRFCGILVTIKNILMQEKEKK